MQLREGCVQLRESGVAAAWGPCVRRRRGEGWRGGDSEQRCAAA